ncbi:hypothetical protein NL676_036321 [Syzygium grande]|nr:hypothetical protein NL676_036321 [Syzygium grande]
MTSGCLVAPHMELDAAGAGHWLRWRQETDLLAASGKCVVLEQLEAMKLSGGKNRSNVDERIQFYARPSYNVLDLQMQDLQW